MRQTTTAITKVTAKAMGSTRMNTTKLETRNGIEGENISKLILAKSMAEGKERNEKSPSHSYKQNSTI